MILMIRPAKALRSRLAPAFLVLGSVASGPVCASPATSPAPVPAPASAQRNINDSKYGGRGTDPLPLPPTAVHLRSAEVRVTEIPVQDGWQVSATYDLQNPGATPAALSLLLPEDRCAAHCTSNAGVFQELGARFGDELVTPTAAPAEALRPFVDREAPQGYLYRISVPQWQSRKLSLEYRFDISEGSQYSGVSFLSSAGRWGGPVAQMRYILELKHPTPYVIYPRAFKLGEFSESPGKGGAGSVTRIVFTAEGVAARSDFQAIFPADSVVGTTRAGFCQGFRGDLSDEELSPVLSSYDPARLLACRDLVLSLHGSFARAPAPRAPALPSWADPRSFAIATRPADPAYRETRLAPGEQAYLKALTAAERRRTK